jgi:dihydropteroate synthase
MSTAHESIWKLNHERAVHLDRPFLVGVLNITPDSFADGGEYNDPALALDRARRLQGEGANALDIGGESTRPGATRVSACEQIDRVVPVIRAIRDAGIELPITIDTTRAETARAALRVGADAINDVSAASEDEGMLALAAEMGCGLILMHRERPPDQDRYSDAYEQAPVVGSVTDRVVDALRAGRDRAAAAGVDPACVMLDPGLGFGKDVDQNLELINSTPSLVGLGHPVMSALSRKSFVGRAGLGRDSEPSERLPATIAFSVMHLLRGALVFRVHDVAEHRQALDAAWALMARESADSPSESAN